MFLEFFLDVIDWLKDYYQRCHCESFYSSFKRVFGIITKGRFSCRLTQVTARIIIHNFRRLSYFKRIEN
jgi:transposase